MDAIEWDTIAYSWLTKYWPVFINNNAFKTKHKTHLKSYIDMMAELYMVVSNDGLSWVLKNSRVGYLRH